MTASELGEALARRVESADTMTSQHAYKMAQRAAQDAGLTVDLGPVPDNVTLDDAGRKEWAERFRGWR